MRRNPRNRNRRTLPAEKLPVRSVTRIGDWQMPGFWTPNYNPVITLTLPIIGGTGAIAVKFAYSDGGDIDTTTLQLTGTESGPYVGTWAESGQPIFAWLVGLNGAATRDNGGLDGTPIAPTLPPPPES